MLKYQHLLFVTFLMLSTGYLHAVKAKPGTREYIQPDDSKIEYKVVGDEFLHFAATPDGTLLFLDEDGYYKPGKIDVDGAVVAADVSPYSSLASKQAVNIKNIDRQKILELRRKSKQRKTPQSGMGLMGTEYQTTGSPRGVIILVEYSDVKFNSSYDAAGYFRDMINGENFTQFGATGSALQYFKDQSRGKFTPKFDVYGPVTLPNKQAYYGANDRFGDDLRPEQMVIDAVNILDSKVDFSVYDTNGDRLIDNIYIIYAGQGEADSDDSNTVWPHTWDVRAAGIHKQVDGVYLGRYACSNEWLENMPDGMGSFVHEFSHVIGLPDLYNTLQDGDYTPGSYSVLDYGNYNNNSRTPCNYGAFERNALGWEDPVVLGDAQSLILPDISTGKFCLIPTAKDTEFFLLENRQLSGWDKYLANHGMLIWHIDYVASTFDSNTVNTTEGHQHVDIMEANNIAGYDYEEGYTFPGTTGNRSFTSSTTPALKSWDGKAIDIPITNIAEKDGKIYFDVCGGGSKSVEAGVKEVEADTVSELEYFNLQGVRIFNPEKGMLVIEKAGNSVRKVII